MSLLPVWAMATLTLSSLATEAPRGSIIGGEPTRAEEFGAVVAIVADQGLCTGTLVAPDLVLTAAHCLLSVQDPAQIFVGFGSQLVLSESTVVGVVDFGVHPEFCEDCEQDIFDYAYLVLDGDFPGTPPPVMRPIAAQEEWNELMRDGQSVTLVGYGVDPGDPKGMASFGLKRKVDTTISRLSTKGFEFFAGGDDRDSCEGDSGGPAFLQLPDGTWRLAGITSRGSDPCGNGGFYGVPYPALQWLDEETGVNLCGNACAACDCLDMTPEEEGMCRIGTDARPSLGLTLLLLAGVVARRRRRS